MKKSLILALPLFLAVSVQAQIYKCVETDGKPRFSDMPCKETEKSEAVPNNTLGVSEQEQQEARQRTVKMQEEINVKEKDNRISQIQEKQKYAEEAKNEKQEQSMAEAKSVEAVSNCIHDIEQRGASQDIKGACPEDCVITDI